MVPDAPKVSVLRTPYINHSSLPLLGRKPRCNVVFGQHAGPREVGVGFGALTLPEPPQADLDRAFLDRACAVGVEPPSSLGVFQTQRLHKTLNLYGPSTAQSM